MPIRASTSTKPLRASPERAADPRGSSGPRDDARTHARNDGYEASKSAKGIGAFPEHYPAARAVPKLPAGKDTIDTFDEAQVRALHRAYWSADATASLGDMAKLAFKDPAFKGRAMDAATERQIGRMFEKLPESFPWGWRSRTLAATSCLLVDALVRTPAGTSVTSIIEGLQKRDPAFPTLASFSKASRDGWVNEPERFPFAKHLVNEGPPGGYKLEARGKAPAIRKDGQGRFVMTRELAEKVRELSTSPAIEYAWTRADFARFVDDQLDGGGAFTESTLTSIRGAFPRVAPEFNEVRAAWRERIAVTIHELYTKEGIDTADGLIQALHERLSTPLWKSTMITWFRQQHPDLVPELQADKHASAYADARALLDAVLASPDTPRLHVGRALGHSDERVRELFKLVAKRWPDELETSTRTPITKDDVRMLRQAMADVPLNATMRDLMRVLEQEHPLFLERHPYSTPESLYSSAVVSHGGLSGSSWNEEQQGRYVEVFVDAVKRSPEGTALKEIVNVILDEHQGAYSLSNVNNLLVAARKHEGAPGKAPPPLAALLALRDRSGAFPWERAKVKLTFALAQRVGREIEARPGAKVIDVVRVLQRDAAFMKQNPTFTTDHVHHLRARYPKVVPYVDDGPLSATRGKRLDAQRKALDAVARKVAAKANEADDRTGLTIAGLARATGTKPHRVVAAIRQAPALFPWYTERPSGRVDLYLATKVGHAIESAPLGTTLEQVVDGMRADESFRERYPQFNYFSVSRLRERYPEIVPAIHARNQILRSKILVDAIVVAKKGTPYAEIFDAVSRAHPGQFPEAMASEDAVKALWASEPARFPFTAALASRTGAVSLVGRGLKPAAKDATPDEVLATQLAKLEQIRESLPVLDRLVDGIKGKPFANTEILAIQHLLGPQVAMFDAARKLGMAPARTSIVGIPYSVSDTVVDTLADKGYDVRVPPLDLESWYGMVKDAMEERIESALKNGRKIVVFDDGGLVQMMFEKHPHLAEHAHLFRIVEQTTRGITVADGVDLHTPVVNVAQSWAKFVEGPMVGSTVQKKLLKRLAGLGVEGVKGKHIGVTGFGTIGAPLAEFLRQQGAKVTVLDVGEDAQKRAKEAGFDVVDGRDDKARAKFFGKQDILVGATGRQSMTAADLEHMKDGAILGSSSSKLVEIDVETLKALSKRGKIEVVDAESFPPTVRYHLKDGRTIDLLASGFPMNFDGSVEDVAAERIQLTMGLMLAGAMTVAKAHLHELEKRHGARDHDLRHR